MEARLLNLKHARPYVKTISHKLNLQLLVLLVNPFVVNTGWILGVTETVVMILLVGKLGQKRLAQLRQHQKLHILMLATQEPKLKFLLRNA